MSTTGHPSNRLKRLREAAGLSRKQLAAEMPSTYAGSHGPISERTIYRWEAGGSIPLSRAQWLAERFGCSIDHLLGLSEPNGNGGARTGPERRRVA